MIMEQLWDLVLNNFVGCLLVFTRVMGIFAFNPIFGRQNTPVRVRIMMSMAMAVCMTAMMGGTTGYIPESVPGFVLTLILEAALGLAFGFVTNLFLSVLFYAGEMTDSKIGLAMANVMDPGSGIQMPLFANLYYYLFILYFFITGAHLTYVRLFYLSFQIIPVGFRVDLNTVQLTHDLIMFFATVLVLALKLAMPVIASGMIVEISVGVIMKAVPTIQVFVVNIQLKILVGIFVILALAGPISSFVDMLVDLLNENLYYVLYNFI